VQFNLLSYSKIYAGWYKFKQQKFIEFLWGDGNKLTCPVPI